MKTGGFMLVETVLAMFISTIVLFGGVAALLYSFSASHRMFSAAMAGDDANLLEGFLSRDMRMASQFSFHNQEVWITEDDGTVNSYWLDPLSSDIDRAVDGEGAVVVSTNVQSISFAVLAEGGLQTRVDYMQNGVSFEALLQDDFMEGSG